MCGRELIKAQDKIDVDLEIRDVSLSYLLHPLLLLSQAQHWGSDIKVCCNPKDRHVVCGMWLFWGVGMLVKRVTTEGKPTAALTVHVRDCVYAKSSLPLPLSWIPIFLKLLCCCFFVILLRPSRLFPTLGICGVLLAATRRKAPPSPNPSSEHAAELPTFIECGTVIN